MTKRVKNPKYQLYIRRKLSVPYFGSRQNEVANLIGGAPPQRVAQRVARCALLLASCCSFFFTLPNKLPRLLLHFPSYAN